VIKLIKYLLWKNNVVFSRAETHNSLGGLFKKCLRRGITFNNIFDVGAYKGLWSEEVRRYVPSANFFLFEPNSDHNSEILSRGFVPRNYLLFSTTGETIFYRGASTGDSIYPETRDGKDSNPVRTQTWSLDDLLKLNPEIPKPDFLKLDTQGSEIDILRGAKQSLSDCKVILTETPFLKYNHGAPTLEDYIKELISMDFVPVHLVESHLVRDVLVQTDIAWLRKSIFDEYFFQLDARTRFWKLTMEDLGR